MMSYKKIVVSDGGKFKEIDASIDNTSLSSSIPVHANTASVGLQNGLLSVDNGQINELTGTVVNQVLKYSGSQYTLVDTNGASVIEVGGDLKFIDNKIQIDNISNVQSGTLGSTYGGIGNSQITASINSGSFVPSRQETIKPLEANKLLVKNKSGSSITSDLKSYISQYMTQPMVFLYTGTVGSDRVITWTKPVGCRAVRIICQGGGGGGGGGWMGNSTSTGGGGAGGAGGGFTDIIFNALSIPSTVTVTAGKGGVGGVGITPATWSGGTVPANTYGGNGGDSVFYKVRANAGTGGSPTSLNRTTGNLISIGIGGTAGSGYVSYGGAGGTASTSGTTNPREPGGSLTKFGAPGGGAGVPRTTSSAIRGGSGGSITYSGISLAGGLGGLSDTSGVADSTINGASGQTANLFPTISSYYLNNVLISGLLPNLLCAGGGGGGYAGYSSTLGAAAPMKYAGAGASAAYGAGGGGGGSTTFYSSTVYLSGGPGGNGGVGYVLIFCW